MGFDQIEGTDVDDSAPSSGTEELLFQYVGLKAQVRALQHEMKALYPDVIRVMKESEDKREVGGALVSYQTRNRYKFSQQIQTLSEELKVRKKHEIESGVAEVESVTESVVVKFK